MQSTQKMRVLYEEIRKQLFFMIPEKWDRIDLYASVIEVFKDEPVGEMFFYYQPKGIIKKNPVNVYEVPSKFNIDEESYLKLASKLYDTIKQLYFEFKNQNMQRIWTNLTIKIENVRFTVEYDYEPIVINEKENQKRRVIWIFENLEFPIESFNKKERILLEEYITYRRINPKDTDTYTEGIYQNEKNTHNVVSYGYESFGGKESSSSGEKRKQKLTEELEELEEGSKKPHKRNQILN